jgi:hypothetical protein
MIINLELSDEEINLLKEWDVYLQNNKDWLSNKNSIEHRMDEFCLKLRARLVVVTRDINL